MLKPPADPAIDNMTWHAWDVTAREMAFPGWSPCRFPHRTAPADGPEMARFVFGITRGPFGIWQQAYDVCSFAEDGERQVKVSTQLYTLTHLPTGWGFGLFTQRDHAALAADSAARACPEWSDEIVSPEAMDRTRDVLNKVGIRPEPIEFMHAHDQSTGQGPFLIWSLATLEDGKPERLS
jgi:hypothetical protein